MDIRFYKTENLPTSAPSGSIWFNPKNKRITLVNSSGNIVFGSELQSAKYENNTLTLTKYNGENIVIPIGEASSTEGVETLLANKLNKIKINGTLVSSIDLNLKGANGTTITESSGVITISSSNVPTKVSQLTNDSKYLTSVPKASSDTLGGIKVGAGLAITTDGILSATGGGTADSVAWENIVGTPKTFTPASHTHAISDITELKTTLDNKVEKVSGKSLSTNDFTNDYKTKLDGLTNYSLPIASVSTLGGVKVGAGLTINNGVLSATGGGTADSVDWSNVQNKPTKLSEFKNDTNFITNNALTNYALKTSIPTKTSSLTNDSGYLTEEDLPKVKDGTTFTPSVSDTGVLSWTNDGEKANPKSVNIKGPKGDKGDKGEDGTGVTILGSYSSLSELQTAHPTGNSGDSYLINGNLYVWSVTEAAWKNVGTIQGPKGDKGDKGDTGTSGIGISNITSSGNTASGATNTITVSLTDNTTKTFTVKNGTDGANTKTAHYTPNSSDNVVGSEDGTKAISLLKYDSKGHITSSDSKFLATINGKSLLVDAATNISIEAGTTPLVYTTTLWTDATKYSPSLNVTDIFNAYNANTPVYIIYKEGNGASQKIAIYKLAAIDGTETTSGSMYFYGNEPWTTHPQIPVWIAINRNAQTIGDIRHAVYGITVATTSKIGGVCIGNGISVTTNGIISVDSSKFQTKLTSGTDIKTINGESILGSGNITISSGLGSLPVASESTLGGVKIKKDGGLTVDTSGNLSVDTSKDVTVKNSSGDVTIRINSNSPETWSFTLEDGSVITKTVILNGV